MEIGKDLLIVGYRDDPVIFVQPEYQSEEFDLIDFHPSNQ